MSADVLRKAAASIRAMHGNADRFMAAVADWLDSLADAMTNPDAPGGSVSTDREERHALAVARAYLGYPS